MRHLLYIFSLFCMCALFFGCTLPPIPKPSTNNAIIILYTTPGRTLSAQKIDKIPVTDSRYFNVSAGQHTLLVRFQYDASELGLWNRDSTKTCLMSFNFDFMMGKYYTLEAQPSPIGGKLILSSEEEDSLLLPLTYMQCGPF